jgi:Protein of unknown function (DUF1571)
MVSGKDVGRWVLAIVVGLVCCGCSLFGGRRPPNSLQGGPPAPPPSQQAAATAPGAPVRIPSSAAPTAPSPPAPALEGASPVGKPPAPAAVTGPGAPSGALAGGTPTVALPNPVPPQPPAPLPRAHLPTSTTPPDQMPLPAPTLTPVSTPSAQAAPKPTTGLARMRQLHAEAVAEYTTLNAFTARLTRREQVNGKDGLEEVIQFQFRKQPWSVHMTWVGKQYQGREVIYVQGQYDDKIHTLLAPGERGLLPFKKIALPPDDPKVRERSRHRITEAGFGHMIEGFGQVLDGTQRGDPGLGSLTYLGPQFRPESSTPLESVEQTIPPGVEQALPGGGIRLWFFSPENHLPILMSTRDQNGHEVEYYWFDGVQPAQLGNADFDPERLGAKK